jgi:CRP-like cAMP-binding protein
MIDDIAARVAAQPFFATLEPIHLRALCEDATISSYEPAQRIFAAGDIADRFWLIESGGVALDLRVPGRGDQVIETLVAGTVLGWSWLHPPYRWHFGAVARERVDAVTFDASSVRARCDGQPPFGYAILRLFTPVIVDRLQATRLRVLDLYATPTQVGRS